MSDWISVDDRLPNLVKRVLVVWDGVVQNHAAILIKDKDDLHSWYFNKEVDVLPFDSAAPVTHWMPLPEPPNVSR
jgi:hypothetical protein